MSLPASGELEMRVVIPLYHSGRVIRKQNTHQKPLHSIHVFRHYMSYDASWSPDDIFTCMNIYPFCPLRRTPLVSAFWSGSLISQKPHLSQVRLDRLLVRRKLVGRKTHGTVLSHCSQPSHKFQHGTYIMCFGVLSGHLPSTTCNWWH